VTRRLRAKPNTYALALPTKKTATLKAAEVGTVSLRARMADERDTKRPRVDDEKPAEHLPRGTTETADELEHRWCVGSIDQGTSSTRFLIFNGAGDPVASHQIEFENLYPESG
jgi:hypothetical protein